MVSNTAVLIPDLLNEQRLLILSIVGYGIDGLVYVGDHALNNFEIPPQNMISSFKRLIGKTYVL